MDVEGESIEGERWWDWPGVSEFFLLLWPAKTIFFAVEIGVQFPTEPLSKFGFQ